MAKMPKAARTCAAYVAALADNARTFDAAVPAADVLVMAAAVADFRPANAIEGKVKKTGREYKVGPMIGA